VAAGITTAEKDEEEMNRINAAIGNPEMMYELYVNEFPHDLSGGGSVSGTYNDAHIIPALKERILDLHVMTGHIKAEDVSRWHVVVTAGATQGVEVAMRAPGLKRVLIRNPAWPRLNAIASSIGLMNFPTIESLIGDSQNPGYEMFSEVVTSPNNPTGAIVSPAVGVGGVGASFVVHDATYLWPQFGVGAEDLALQSDPHSAAYVFSLSKLTGHASMRIGWILTTSEHLEKTMREDIEVRTSGVSNFAQDAAAEILGHAMESEGRYLELVGFELARRRRRFQAAVAKINLRDVSERGMFAVVESSQSGQIVTAAQEFSVLGIDVFDGVRFGLHPHQIRVNLALASDDFEEMLRRIK